MIPAAFFGLDSRGPTLKTGRLEKNKIWRREMEAGNGTRKRMENHKMTSPKKNRTVHKTGIHHANEALGTVGIVNSLNAVIEVKKTAIKNISKR